MNTITLVPAYGRDYKSKKALLADYVHQQKDFIVVGYNRDAGRCMSIRDTEALLNDGYTHIQFRYNKLQSTFIHPISITEAIHAIAQ